MKLPQQGRRIVWLVRLLAAIGLAIVVSTTGLVGWTLARVRSERALVDAEQDRLEQASKVLRERAVRSRIEIQTVLDETSARTNGESSVAGLEESIQQQLDSRPDPAVLPSLQQLRACASQLAEFAGRAEAWRASYAVVWEDLRQEKTMGRVRDLITRLRTSVEMLEGRRRLDEAIKYRAWRKAGGEEAARRAGEIIREHARRQSHDSADFKNQLAEFARLVELLGGEEQFDSLTDLKDNKLKPVLDRMSRSIAAFGSEASGEAALQPRTIEDLKVTLFGEGYVSDDAYQNVQAGRGGLFTLRRDALSLRRERENLKNELGILFQNIETANASFAQSTLARTTALALEMERSLAAGWRHMVIFGSGCSALFLWLAWIISRGINGQVGALDQARAEAEQSRQTMQKLMLEQQAAAAELAEAHRELKASEQRQELIFKSISEGIHMIDLEGRIVFENPASARMLGWEATKLVGQPAHVTMHHTRADGSAYPQRECHIYAGLHTGAEHHVVDEVFWRKDGTSFPVEYTSTPVCGQEGEVIGVVVVFADITERKRADQELVKAQKQLVETSRMAGMAEIATSVLHNVGNVLNSVNVSANLLADRLRKTPIGDIGRVAGLLREQGANLGAFFTSDPRGPKVPEFLTQLVDKFTRQQESQLAEVAALQKNIEHIKEIVAMQQSFAKVSGLTESLSAVELIEDALRMNARSFQKHEVELARELAADLPKVCVDKHKVLQILVNLLRNAKHACDDAGRADKRITVRAVSANERVRITIADNGVGIPAENLNRIFNHGFTTKKTGHGFGLHSAANAAKEMGGSVSVHSDGAGLGASFTLELPAEAKRGPNLPAPDPAHDRTGLNSDTPDSKGFLAA